MRGAAVLRLPVEKMKGGVPWGGEIKGRDADLTARSRALESWNIRKMCCAASALRFVHR
jgi:hypothetical protein